MRKWIYGLVLTVVLASLTACGNEAAEETQEPVKEEQETLEEEQPQISGEDEAQDMEALNDEADEEDYDEDFDVLSSEVQKAIACGLVPDGLQGEMDQQITFKEYTELMNNLIAMWDESKLEEWKSITSKALESDEEMYREDGILEMSYAMVLLNVNELDQFFNTGIDETMEKLDYSLDELSWNYPLFPDWEEPAVIWNENAFSNYMWGGVQLCAVNTSHVSGLAIYPYDTENMTGHFREPLTREEAISAVLRLGETDNAIFASAGEYVNIADAGTYDTEIITDEIMNAPSTLPDVKQDQLPSTWRGIGLSCGKNEGTEAGIFDFRDTDVKLISDEGFNFTRVFYSFSTMRFPAYPEDPMLVNMDEIRDIDRLVAWGRKYNVHIQLSMNMYLDENGNVKKDFSMPSNDKEWEMTKAYWTMLARRYKGIDSKYISFDLCNEVQPHDKNLDKYQKKMAELVEEMRQTDPDRVLLYSFPGNPNMEWVESVAELGVAIGCHPYYPAYLTTTGNEYAEKNPYAKPVWPQPYFPRGNVQNGIVPITIQGEIGDSDLSFAVTESHDKVDITVSGDGSVLETFHLSGGEKTEQGDCTHYGELFTTHVPAGVKEVNIQVQQGRYAQIETVIVKGKAGETVMVPHDATDIADESDPLPLIVNADGSYTNSENRMIDDKAVYDAKVKPMKDIADNHTVGFMVNEIGVFGTRANFDVDVVMRYQDDILKMLNDNHIGWCYCELYNTFPKHLCVMPGRNNTQFQWANSTAETVKVKCDSGAKMKYTVNVELRELFKKYLKE